MALTVAILGRPNVGKSTLFNRLIGRSLALVDDTPGVTRDRRYGKARIGSFSFTAIDTAGLEDAEEGTLAFRMRGQTERALAEADVALLIYDARAGLTQMDRQFAEELRKSPTPVILVANKCEGRKGDAGLYEAFELGLGDPVPLSAAHGQGMADLVEALLPYERPDAPPPSTAGDDDGGIDPLELDEEELARLAEDDTVPAPDALAAGPIQLAIIGRPNAGKSTLVNALLHDDRVLTGPEPGVTRDSISVDWSYKDRAIRLVDTAGMRRRSRVQNKVERLSVSDALNSVRLSQVVVLVMDAESILDKQDLTIARHVVEEGRALVVAVNKWDTVADHKAVIRRLKDRLETSLAQVRDVATVTISALRGQRLTLLMDTVLETYDIWNKRVSTARLNRWLYAMMESHPPPMVSGRRLKLRYITQVKARPPTFALWSTRPDELPDAYSRYLVNGLRDAFDMPGVPIRLLLRKIKNPYDKG
ncbi:ribosome biogenesis GTPase Der [Fodinicurvata sp. EGI_FJ10296]|uniref:ribosome biogenesis GTPase Der n=1 Tax=Fodinicurvata sp. EGI_FJ10296 TaxID=3231908 RepID=UPI00345340A8